MVEPVDLWVDNIAKHLAANRWQMQYANPDWQEQMTKLPAKDEAKFLLWAQQNNAPLTDDYDMRGYWQEQAASPSLNANDGKLHYPDTYKTPLHQSFSGESKFALPGGPTWNEKDQLVAPNGQVLFDERAQKAR